jgi:hypothetical protein
VAFGPEDDLAQADPVPQATPFDLLGHENESLSFFAWMIIGVLLVANLKYRIKILGSFLTPIALILMLFAFALPKEILPLAPVLKSFWHPFHVIEVRHGNHQVELLLIQDP